MSRATQSELLDQRIAENVAAQQIDLATWIFERVKIRPGDRVLELCCGTGGQTLPLLDRVGPNGQVVAIDISRSALETLAAKVGATDREKLTLIDASLESFPESMQSSGVGTGFDLVFCAYGLYYSGEPLRTLKEALKALNPGGRIAVVGPFGPNNKPLFDLVRASGVIISQPVVFSSEQFMLQTVVPWAAEEFQFTAVHTMVNPVLWTTPERVLNYWQNTTFYDAEKRVDFERLVRRHFTKEPVLVNQKWVMLVEMRDARR